MAAEKNAVEMGILLISKGADINAKMIDYLNMILKFSINGLQKKVWQLNKKNWVPLHRAVQYQSKEMVELLLSKGANIDAREIIYLNMIKYFELKQFNINQGYIIKRIEHHFIGPL